LEFVNTIDPRHGDASHDYLGSYTDLVAWSHYAGQLSAPERDRLLRSAHHRPGDAARTFARAIALREALYRLFSALAQNDAPSPADLAAVQAAYAQAIRHAALVKTPAGFAWTWPMPDGALEEALEQMLWPLAASAIALLTSERLSRVKECAVGEGGCGWLFLVNSKNGSRRWCRMEGCGSRAKMRRQYARKRRSRDTGTPSPVQEAE
jgi:predicted RNA-binding Zn ribbon-like protein